MAKTILGIILLAVPFLCLAFFKDKKIGSVYIIFFSFLFHTALAFFTQFFGVFNYGVVLAITLIFEIILLIFWHQNRRSSVLVTRDFLKKIDWVLLLVAVIAFLSLYQVHYNYTGKINFATDTEVSYHEVKNMKYEYPYFSDEWYAVLLIENSIDSGHLPLAGFGGRHFLNLEIFFHSFVSEIMLILGLNVLTKYTLISIFFNILIVVLAYLFLRISKVSQLSSAVSSLLILYIASGANLPGIWNFMPVHMGIIFCLIGFCFMAAGKTLPATIVGLPVIIFYAPLFIFYGIALLTFGFPTKVASWRDCDEPVKMRFALLSGLLLLVLPFIYIVLMVSPFGDLVSSKLLYTSFYGDKMNVNFNFYNVIPFFAVVFGLFGLGYIYKKLKWFLAVLILGFSFWIFYSFTTTRFLIEYERVVFFTSILVCIASGFGLQFIGDRFEKFNRYIKYLEAVVFVAFLVFALFYTRAENWKSFVVRDITGSSLAYYPKAPANNYLIKEDLEIFIAIRNKNFLSIPWKGTVIGVATKNNPLSIKQGTISSNNNVLSDFLLSDCKGKEIIAEQEKIDYVYLSGFKCPQFKEIQKSPENLILYEFSP